MPFSISRAYSSASVSASYSRWQVMKKCLLSSVLAIAMPALSETAISSRSGTEAICAGSIVMARDCGAWKVSSNPRKRGDFRFRILWV